MTMEQRAYNAMEGAGLPIGSSGTLGGSTILMCSEAPFLTQKNDYLDMADGGLSGIRSYLKLSPVMRSNISMYSSLTSSAFSLGSGGMGGSGFFALRALTSLS